MDLNPNAPPETDDLQLAGHPEFPEVTATYPPGTNPAPAKSPKAVNKRYYIAMGSVPDDNGLIAVVGAPEGYRTQDDVRKFVKTLEPGEYTRIAAFTEKIVVQDVRRVKGV